MDISINLELLTKIKKTIEQNSVLFSTFKEVYIFGSVLSIENLPNDVDILLVYSDFEINTLIEIDRIQLMIEDEIGLPADLTVLSDIEKKDTQFLTRIKNKYIRVI